MRCKFSPTARPCWQVLLATLYLELVTVLLEFLDLLDNLKYYYTEKCLVSFSPSNKCKDVSFCVVILLSEVLIN